MLVLASQFGCVSEIQPIHSLQYALQNPMANFHLSYSPNVQTFFINGFDTESFLLIVKSTKNYDSTVVNDSTHQSMRPAECKPKSKASASDLGDVDSKISPQCWTICEQKNTWYTI